MLLNGKVIEIVSYTSENIDDDLIIYNESFKKIIILNHTAKYVWNLIVGCYNNGEDIEVSDIVSHIKDVYNISQCEDDNIYNDVEETLDLFFKASLLRCSDEEHN